MHIHDASFKTFSSTVNVGLLIWLFCHTYKFDMISLITRRKIISKHIPRTVWPQFSECGRIVNQKFCLWPYRSIIIRYYDLYIPQINVFSPSNQQNDIKILIYIVQLITSDQKLCDFWSTLANIFKKSPWCLILFARFKGNRLAEQQR